MKWLNRKAIHDAEWDHRVDTYGDGLPYAYSWYLDIVANKKWMVLTDGSGNWFLPLPYNRKMLGFRQFYQPFFCQQLGFLGPHPPKADMLPAILAEIKRKCFRYQISIHESNFEALQDSVIPRTNYVLDLQEPYDNIAKKFSRSLKNNLKKAIPSTWTLHEGTSDDTFLPAYFAFNFIIYGKKDKIPRAMVIELVETLVRKKMAYFLTYTDEIDNPAAGCFFIKTASRYILLLQYTNADERKYSPGSQLLHYLIRNRASNPVYLDFEGSDIPGVGTYFSSFGSEKRQYGLMISK